MKTKGTAWAIEYWSYYGNIGATPMLQQLFPHSEAIMTSDTAETYVAELADEFNDINFFEVRHNLGEIDVDLENFSLEV